MYLEILRERLRFAENKIIVEKFNELLKKTLGEKTKADNDKITEVKKKKADKDSE